MKDNKKDNKSSSTANKGSAATPVMNKPAPAADNKKSPFPPKKK